MKKIDEILAGVKTMAIAGHVRPDGDCIGSCMGLYLYVKKNFPWIEADVYLEPVRDVFNYIKNIDLVKQEYDREKSYDLFFCLDVSSVNRIGVAEEALTGAKRSFCLDHHITNQGIADDNLIVPDASSASEVLYTVLDPALVDKDTATAIYTGMIHDSGVFQYSNTSGETLRIAADLVDKGIDFSHIISGSFYEKTYVQNRIMGKVLMDSELHLGGRIVSGIVTASMEKEFGVVSGDLEGIVSQLRLTTGTVGAIFMYPMDDGGFKVSLRSDDQLDVSKVASVFGGGGHKKAAGCSFHTSPSCILEQLLKEIEKQIG